MLSNQKLHQQPKWGCWVERDSDPGARVLLPVRRPISHDAPLTSVASAQTQRTVTDTLPGRCSSDVAQGTSQEFSFFPLLLLLFSSSFLIFSSKSPRAPHISHSTCFPGYFQIRGSEDSLGGSGRALSPYPSPYLETSDEKDSGRKLIIVTFLCGSKW